MPGSTEYACTRPSEGASHYLHYFHHSLASGETTGREHSAAQEHKIGLKICWAGPRPSEQDPVSHSVSFSHESSISLLYLSKRAVQFSLSPVFATPWTAARQASLSITNSQNLLKLTTTESVMPSNYLILCCPLLLPPSIFLSITVFSNVSVLHIGSQSIGVAASASVLPMNIQD